MHKASRIFPIADEALSQTQMTELDERIILFPPGKFPMWIFIIVTLSMRILPERLRILKFRAFGSQIYQSSLPVHIPCTKLSSTGEIFFPF